MKMTAQTTSLTTRGAQEALTVKWTPKKVFGKWEGMCVMLLVSITSSDAILQSNVTNTHLTFGE